MYHLKRHELQAYLNYNDRAGKSNLVSSPDEATAFRTATAAARALAEHSVNVYPDRRYVRDRRWAIVKGQEVTRYEEEVV